MSIVCSINTLEIRKHSSILIYNLYIDYYLHQTLYAFEIFIHLTLITTSWGTCCSVQFSSVVQSLSRVRLFVTPWIGACQASLSITNTQIHVHWVSDAIQPSHPLSSPSPPAPVLHHGHWTIECGNDLQNTVFRFKPQESDSRGCVLNYYYAASLKRWSIMIHPFNSGIILGRCKEIWICG